MCLYRLPKKAKEVSFYSSEPLFSDPKLKSSAGMKRCAKKKEILTAHLFPWHILTVKPCLLFHDFHFLICLAWLQLYTAVHASASTAYSPAGQLLLGRVGGGRASCYHGFPASAGLGTALAATGGHPCPSDELCHLLKRDIVSQVTCASLKTLS